MDRSCCSLWCYLRSQVLSDSFNCSQLHRWSTGDAYLLSCSSDGQSKIWKCLETEGSESWNPFHKILLTPLSLRFEKKTEHSRGAITLPGKSLPFLRLTTVIAACPYASPLPSSIHLLCNISGFPTFFFSTHLS